MGFSTRYAPRLVVSLIALLGFAYACSGDSDEVTPGFDAGAGLRIDATTNPGSDGASADGAVTGDDASTTNDASAGDATVADVTVVDADVDACALGTALSCESDSGTELRCDGDGGVVAVPCDAGCHPDAGRCVEALSVDAGPDPVVPLEASTTLSAVVTGGLGPFTYAWSPTTGLDDASSPQPVVTPQATTPYTVTVTDVRAQTASDSVLVKVPDAPLALMRWTVVNYNVATQGVAGWSFLDGGTIAVQSVNADPSLLVSDFDLSAFEVTGRFSVTNAAGDDDFIGFAFGYQDARHFYLFDWKAVAQANGACGTAARGMVLRRIDTGDAGPTCLTLWANNTADAGSTVVSPASANDVAWVAGTTYDFKLTHDAAGQITIEVRNTATQALVGSVSATDTTWLKGRFAFYNFSQANARYEFFRMRDLP